MHLWFTALFFSSSVLCFKMADVKENLKSILTPAKSLAVYHLKYKDAKGTELSGADGASHFMPNPDYAQTFYNLIFHDILIPMSKIPLDSILAVDPTDLLPSPTAPDFTEQCLGLITILDQTRVLTGGSYNQRYTRSFFDPICEQLVRKLVALPSDLRPDGKDAWLSRGYTFSQFLSRVLMIWAPLVHSDDFMVNDRQRVKDFLHAMRSEVESHYSVTDPFAALEAADDIDIHLFGQMIAEGPPTHSFADLAQELKIWEYAFWWIRILNAHFALTDMCGHYPYASEWKGNELTEKDREFLEKTDYALYDRSLAPVFELVGRDVREGVWRPLAPVERFER